LDDVEMTVCYRIKTTRINCAAHGGIMFRVSGSGFLVPDKPSAFGVFRSAFCLSLRTGIEGSAPGTRNSKPGTRTGAPRPTPIQSCSGVYWRYHSRPGLRLSLR
jgi:hypothetical protein